MPFTKSEIVVINNETDPYLPEGEWYRLRKYLNWRQAQQVSKLKALAMKAPNILKGGGTEEKMDLSIDMTEVYQSMLEVYIVEWSHSQPLNSFMIGELDPRTLEILVRACDQLLEEQKNKAVDPKVPQEQNSNGLLGRGSIIEQP